MGKGRFVVAVVAAVVAACATPPPKQPAPSIPEVVVAPPPPVAKTPRELAREALALFNDKQYDQAVPALTEAARAYPEVAPFLRLRIAEAEVARGNVQDAAAVLSEIIALSDSSAATVARLRLPAVFAQAGDAGSTDAAWEHAMRVAIDELTESDFTSMATALAKAGRADLAVKTRMRLLTEYTSGRYTEETYGYLRDEIAKLTPAEQLEIGAKLARANRYDQALEILNRVDAPEARATRIRALFNSRNYTQLLDETKDLELKDPALILLRARAAWRDDRPQEMLAGVARLEKEFPATAQAAEGRVMRAKYYVTDMVDYPRAIADLVKAIDAGAMGGDGENLWNLGYTYVLWGKDDEALKVFDRYIRSYPDGDWKTNSLFWSAKILDRLGRTEERDAKASQIVAEYPFSYYAYRAKELWPSGAAAASAAGASAGEAPAAPRVFPSLTLPTDPRLATVRALLDIELHRAAAREMKIVAAGYAGNPAVQYMLADVYVQGGEPFKANTVLQREFRDFIRHGGQNIPPRFWQILYPLAYWDTIRTEAERRSLDPYLVASVIRQESGFEPTTVSNAGAVGLMQIMPAEAARIGEVGGLGAVTRGDLFDPAKNIAVGAAEFRQKLDAWDGNQVLAIASYNAGEEPVRGWMARTPLDDIDLFIESIPFAETRLYVKTVTRNRSEYRRIYG